MATNITPLPRDEEPESGRRAAGEMTLLEHLLELRMRVMWMGAAVIAGMMVFFVPQIGFGAIELLKYPASSRLEGFTTQAISPMENLVVYFKVAMLGGLAIGMPMIVFQTFRFISPGLMPNEKKWAYPVAFGASGMFLLGIAFAFYVVLPTAYGFLFQFGAEEIADPTPTISSYIDLTTRLILVCGLVFETPVVIMGLAKLGLVNARKLWGFWRFAFVLSFVASAILTPTPDPVTQALVAIPMFALYILGVGLAWFIRRD